MAGIMITEVTTEPVVSVTKGTLLRPQLLASVANV